VKHDLECDKNRNKLWSSCRTCKEVSTAGILDAARVERQRPRLGGVEPEMEMGYVEFPMRDNLFLRKENMLLLFLDLALM
jgi:hypothetical protein